MLSSIIWLPLRCRQCGTWWALIHSVMWLGRILLKRWGGVLIFLWYWGVLWLLRVAGDDWGCWSVLVMVTRRRRWAGIVDDGGCERLGFGVVDHTQIDCRQTLMTNLGMAGHCTDCGRGTRFCSIEFREFIPSRWFQEPFQQNLNSVQNSIRIIWSIWQAPLPNLIPTEFWESPGFRQIPAGISGGQ